MMLLLNLQKENNIRIKLILFLVFITFLSVTAQEKPDWIYNKPVGNKFIYYVGVGNSKSAQEAFEIAFNSALKSISKEDKVIIHDISKIVKTSNIVKEDGRIVDNSFNQNIFDELNIETSKVIVGTRFVDFFFDTKESTCWVLLAKARYGNSDIDNCLTYSKTPIIWRSALIPGWGQFYKNQTGRGIVFLASEAVMISTTIYCESMRADNMRKSEETLNIDIVKEYRKRADTWELRRNVAIGGAIAVYALNLLDAAKGKGQIKYAFLPDNVDLLAYKEGGINQFGLKITF